MRLLLPSTTIIAALGGAACHQVAKDSTNRDAIVKTKFASDVEAAYKSDPLGQRQQSLQHKRSLAKVRAERSNVTKETQLPDVGILRSGDGGDTTKSNRVFFPLFRHGQKKMSRDEVQRFLQEEEVANTCPVGCPQEFCDCGAEFGEVKYCTKEMLSVCDRGIVSRCVKEEDIEFYEKTYCAFSECVESGQPYENCACGYYEAYCQLFYDYEESFESCVTAECCENTPADDRATCIPAMQPTTNPTAAPTATVPPTVSPTVRFCSCCFAFMHIYNYLNFTCSSEFLLLGIIINLIYRALQLQPSPVSQLSLLSHHRRHHRVVSQPHLQNQLHWLVPVHLRSLLFLQRCVHIFL